jgi:cell wall assembly regulator SMI1
MDKRKPKCSPEIRPVWFDPSWVEFASDGDTALLLDMNPSAKGTMGQVILWELDAAKRKFMWRSFTDFIWDLSECYIKNQVIWKDGLLQRKKGCSFPVLTR